MTNQNVEASAHLERARYLNLQSELTMLLGAGVAAGSIALSYVSDQPAFAALGLAALPVISYANSRLAKSMQCAVRAYTNTRGIETRMRE